jgi:hypothetical protein
MTANGRVNITYVFKELDRSVNITDDTPVSRISLSLVADSATATDAAEHSLYEFPIYWLVRELQRQSIGWHVNFEDDTGCNFVKKMLCYPLKKTCCTL